MKTLSHPAPRLIPLPELLASRTPGYPTTSYSPNPLQDAARTVGIHVYADLKLANSLAAAETDEKALRYLEILQDLAAIADACAAETGAVLLEVQESRVHFLLECERFDGTALGRLIALSAAMTEAVYSIVSQKAGPAWGGFCLAADHGLAVVLFSDCGGGSAISLGNVANRPAKRLGLQPAVGSGNLAIRTELVRFLVGQNDRSVWTELNMREIPLSLHAYTDPKLTARLVARARQAMQTRKAVTQLGGAGTFFESIQAGGVFNPTRMQSFCLRVDLDGFTKQIEVAFAEGPEAVALIVQRFRKILEYPKHFAIALGRRTLLLPWAGDCATILIVSNVGENFHSTRKFLPLVATSKWHEQLTTQQGMGTHLGDAKWAVGIAAGDQQEGNDGWVLIAELVTSGRTFRVAAGWSVRRSNDGCQYDGVRGGDTVLPVTDYNHLDLTYQKGFEDLGSNFKRLTEGARHKAEQDRAARVAASSVATSTPKLPIPAPKPYSW